MIRPPTDLFPYQQKAVEFQCSHGASALWLDMGLGKTVISLTSISWLLSSGFLRGVVIVAPIRVCRLVWRQEAAKWSHTGHLKFAMMTGTKDQRVRALMSKANIYLINYENLEWLAETIQTYYLSKGKPLPFNGIVFDEISKCKNSSTRRVHALKKVLPEFIWRTGLTGTPAGNGYKDLHGQYLVLDDGKRLGTSKTAFENRWYKKAGPYKRVPYGDTHDQIKQLIGDITLEMSAEDYNPLPDMVMNEVEVDLPPDLRAKYEQMEREFFIRLESGSEVEVFNQASLTNKLLQFSNGAVYPIAGMPLWEPLHDLKLDALDEILDECNGQPVLCAYAYRSDAERIMKRFAKLRPINLTDCKSEKSLNDAMRRWTTGDCSLMIGHPACLGADTQVLTERNGWVRIIDVESTDRVFDGVEFVEHDGCSYSGYKTVIEVFGMTMTPDHKLLIDNQWVEAKHADNAIESRDDGRGSSGKLQGIELREKSATRGHPSPRKAHVYDLVNCGPRHRFLIRNNDGEVFISHNSMGHGLDGLQKVGHTLVWYGLNWSLDLYDQFNARIRRQGQGVPVICHRILCRDTMDQAQAMALDAKAQTQTALRSAIKQYHFKKSIAQQKMA